MPFTRGPFVRAAAVLAATALLSVDAQVSAKNTVYCRQTPQAGPPGAFVQDAKCALDVLLVATPDGPGKEVKFYFQVNRTTTATSFEPQKVYEVPTDNRTQLADIDRGVLGLVPGPFDIASFGKLATLFNGSSAPILRKNFSDFGVETLLDPKKAVWAPAAAGVYEAIGTFSFMDAKNVTHDYVAVRDTVDVKESKGRPSFPIRHDEVTTYCWRVDGQATAFDQLPYDGLSFGSNCPITTTVVNPLAATNLVPFDVSWSSAIQPQYMQRGGKGVYDLGLPNSSATLAIAHTTVHFCGIEDDGVCHMFTPKSFVNTSAVDQSGAFGANGTASFAAAGLTLFKGQYIGFAHTVVKRPVDNSWLHVATYFQVKVDEKPQTKVQLIADVNQQPAVAQIADKSYCWKVYAPASRRTVGPASAIGTYSVDDSCPVRLQLTLAKTTVTTNTTTVVQGQASLLPIVSNMVTVATLPDGFNISLASLYICKNASACGPFKQPVAKNTTVLDLEYVDRLKYSPVEWTPTEAGTYTVYFVATIDVGRGQRLDTSVATTITVADPPSAGLSTAAIVGIAGGSVGFVVVVALIWCCVARNRRAKWDHHRLHHGAAMQFKSDTMAMTTGSAQRVHSSVPLVNQRGGITEVPRPFVDEDGNSLPRDESHDATKLDLAVGHYMYDQDGRRIVDEPPRAAPRRVGSQYDARGSSLGYELQPEDLHLGYDAYQNHQPPRANPGRTGYDYDHHHQMVVHDEFEHQRRDRRYSGPREHPGYNQYEYGYDQAPPQGQQYDEAYMSTDGSLQNNYGGYGAYNNQGRPPPPQQPYNSQSYMR
ncbi:Aste57867_1098 [Aphanomyces stellatus]|uniref:Aste57867_1098 protein n=1 Tax=Aphanomyces stellatus TaxID=120398 RepID=A0A485K4C5_9STRA|nr:hypothetical protein As57867_001097 [Aphanomyces stellatus]VFT78320.1 Aste57867_1098 [Aphanomyces stellatus]